MGLDYVDIFYSHCPDPKTPLEETMGALDTAVRQGKALYAGISSYSAELTAHAATVLRYLGTPLLIHQPPYSMLNRWIEYGILDTLGTLGVGCIVFSPLAEGILSDRYLSGIPEGSRASRADSLQPNQLTDETLAKVKALNELARDRGQSLAQMALAWTVRDPRVTSTLVGASSLEQLLANLAMLDSLDFSDEELAADRQDPPRLTSADPAPGVSAPGYPPTAPGAHLCRRGRDVDGLRGGMPGSSPLPGRG